MHRSNTQWGRILLGAAAVAWTAGISVGAPGGGGGHGGGVGHVGSGGIGGGFGGRALGEGHFGGLSNGPATRAFNFGNSTAGRNFEGLNLKNSTGQTSRNLGRSGPAGAEALGKLGSVRGDGVRGSMNKNWNDGEKFAHSNFNRFSDFNRGDFKRGDFNHDDHFHDFHHHGNFVIAPFWWPLWWPAWWGGGYASDYYGYGSPYCYYYDYNNYAPTTADYAVPADQSQGAPDSYLADESGGSSGAGVAFFAQAESAFQAGKYRDAVRLANHAAVESPQNPKAAELMSLALFAAGDYRSAAAQAHAALTLGPASTWKALRGYYGDNVDAYTSQLRALEKYSKDKPDAPEGHFLLAYQYLMTGYTKQAVKQLADVAKLAPGDQLTAELLKQYGGEAPAKKPPIPPQPMAF